MFVGRPFILARSRSRATDLDSQHDSAGGHQSKTEWNFLVEDCVSAAEDTVDVLSEMQYGQLGLAKSSYIEYSSCRASLLVLIAYSTFYRTNKFSTALEKGLDAIGEMATAGESARSEVSLIERLEAALRRLRVFDGASAQPSDTPSIGLEESYESFASWYRTHSAEPTKQTSHRANSQSSSIIQPDTDAETYISNGLMNNNMLSGTCIGNDTNQDVEYLNAGGDDEFANLDFGQDIIDQQLLENLMWIPD